MSLIEQLPKTELRSALRNGVQVFDLQWETDDFLPVDQLAVICSLLVDENPTDAVEIGTNSGSTTRTLADALPSAVIHTLDLPLDWKVGIDETKTDVDLIRSNRSAIGIAFRDRCYPNIRQHYGDSLTYPFANFGSPSFYFIDASHSHAAVMSDSRKAKYSMPNGGTIVWHDVADGHEGVIRALVDLRQDFGWDIRRINDLGFVRF